LKSRKRASLDFEFEIFGRGPNLEGRTFGGWLNITLDESKFLALYALIVVNMLSYYYYALSDMLLFSSPYADHVYVRSLAHTRIMKKRFRGEMAYIAVRIRRTQTYANKTIHEL
jgi:hypothetical protein